MSPATRHFLPEDRRFLTGLIGAPIAHSASPAMHECAAEALGAHCHYQLIEVAGAGREELRMLLDGVRRLGFAGVNVTFPYKEAVVDLLDELSPGAAAMGAVNTVVVRNDRLVGHNTDTTGFALAKLGVAEIRIFDTDRTKAERLALLLRRYAKAVAVNDVEDAVRGAVGV